jgi:hypothetical protein
MWNPCVSMENSNNKTYYGKIGPLGVENFSVQNGKPNVPYPTWPLERVLCAEDGGYLRGQVGPRNTVQSNGPVGNVLLTGATGITIRALKTI